MEKPARRPCFARLPFGKIRSGVNERRPFFFLGFRSRFKFFRSDSRLEAINLFPRLKVERSPQKPCKVYKGWHSSWIVCLLIVKKWRDAAPVPASHHPRLTIQNLVGHQTCPHVPLYFGPKMSCFNLWSSASLWQTGQYTFHSFLTWTLKLSAGYFISFTFLYWKGCLRLLWQIFTTHTS